MYEQLQELVKALEAGSYNAAPGSLVQGSSLQIEDLSPVMNNVTFEDKHIKLQKMLQVKPSKGTLVQFNRQLSYGTFGGSAQLEGGVGSEDVSDFVRAVVPMCYYSHIRRVTIAANMVQAFDGVKAEDRAASDGTKKMAGDVEFDLFRGKGDFSNAGVFDGNPNAIPALPNILGVDAQIRQSDILSNTQDLMFAEFGSDQSVVLQAGGTLTQGIIEDASVRSAMNMGSADRLIVDPLVLSAYNKIVYNKEHIYLAGSPQDATAADLRRQWVSGGTVNLEASRFLSGKTRPARSKANGPVAPAAFVPVDGGSGSPFLNAQVYKYAASAVNELGESALSPVHAFTITGNGKYVTSTLVPVGTVRYWNMYRSVAGGSILKFIGRVKNSGAGSTDFVDLGNKLPGFVTGYMMQSDTLGIHELAPYSRLKLAISDLSLPEAHFRFLTMAMYQPRKNVLVDNLIGSI